MVGESLAGAARTAGMEKKYAEQRSACIARWGTPTEWAQREVVWTWHHGSLSLVRDPMDADVWMVAECAYATARWFVSAGGVDFARAMDAADGWMREHGGERR